MSAIFGIHYLDDRPVSRMTLEEMAAVLAHRGVDGSRVWCSGTIGLGHRMLWTTPESLHEVLPLEDSSGHFVITADARLDNRAELISILRTCGRDLGRETDSELILAAYATWGEGCVERLLGDFAFAIWDARMQILFCARDHFGVKPFYYYSSPGRAFTFASEMKGLFSCPDVPCEINETRVADHLAAIFKDNENTFYRDILRLPPAHSMTVSRERVRTRPYWALDRGREVRLKSNGEYAEAFRELFTEAVSCRLRSAFPIGAMLSGGLDSSSITCVARELLAQNGDPPLSTFSAVFDKVPSCDERQYINAVLAQNNVKPHFIAGDQRGPLQDMEQMHWHQDQAFFAPNISMVWSIYRTAAKAGVRILLDGHDGDSTVSYGYKYLDELAVDGNWLALSKELRGLSRNLDEPFWPMLRDYVRYYGFNPRFRKSLPMRTLRRFWRAALRRLPRQAGHSSDPLQGRALLNESFAARMGVDERYRTWRKTLSGAARTEREAHYRGLTQPLQSFALEVHNSAAAAFALEPRYPFWDKRLVEFCLALPPEQKLQSGWPRMIMRRAMEGIIPSPVQWRAGKTDFTPSLAYGLRVLDRGHLEGIINEADLLEPYVNIGALREIDRRILAEDSQSTPRDLFDLWKIASLAQWLRLYSRGKNGVKEVSPM